MEFKLNFLISFLYKIEKFINKHKKKTIAIFLIVVYQMIYEISPFFILLYLKKQTTLSYASKVTILLGLEVTINIQTTY